MGEDIKMELKEICEIVDGIFFLSGWVSVTGFCEHSNELY
jgi:hypothetical protein